jgi:hypothetical protein
MNKIFAILVPGFFYAHISNAQYRSTGDTAIQLTGTIMSNDSLQPIAAVSITLIGSNQGTTTNSSGVFSIIVCRGDTLALSHISYKTKYFIIPEKLDGLYHNIVQLMVQDTNFRPPAKILLRPSPEQFARDFINTNVSDDSRHVRGNLDETKLRLMMKFIPAGAGEGSRLQFQHLANQVSYQKQVPPMKIFDGPTWYHFIQAWRKGNFKKKRK